MFFFEPVMLWFLGFAIVPPLIHLVNRMRYRSVEWAAIEFVLRAHRSSTRMARIRELLILLLRLLVIVLLVFVLARPVVSRFPIFGFLKGGDEVIVLLDRSASMGIEGASGKNRLRFGLEKLNEAFEQSGRVKSIVVVDGVDNSVRVIKSLKELIDSYLAEPTHVSCSIPAMLSSAYDYMMKNAIRSGNLWIISDSQRADWALNSNEWEKLDAKFSKKHFSGNVFLINCYTSLSEKDKKLLPVSMIRNMADPNQIDIRFKIESQENVNEKIPLVVKNESGTTGREVELIGSSLVVNLTAYLPKNSDRGWTVVELPKDENLFNNRLCYAYGRIKKLYVGINCEEELFGFFRAALTAGVEERADMDQFIEIEEISGKFDREKLKKYSFIIYDLSKLSDFEFEQLKIYLEEGGEVFLFPPMTGVERGMKLFSDIEVKAMEDAGEETLFTAMKFISPQCPLAEEFIELLGFAKFAKRALLTAKGEDLLKYEDGEALLKLFPVGSGKLYLFSAPLSLGNGEFIYNPVFPILLRALVDRSGEKYNVAHQISAHFATEERAGESRRLDEDIVSKHFVSGGIYEVGGEIFGVNPPISEYEDEYVSEENLKKLLSGNLKIYSAEMNSRNQIFSEVWREVLLIVLLCMIVEMLLCSSPLKLSGNKRKVEMRQL